MGRTCSGLTCAWGQAEAEREGEIGINAPSRGGSGDKTTTSSEESASTTTLKPLSVIPHAEVLPRRHAQLRLRPPPRASGRACVRGSWSRGPKRATSSEEALRFTNTSPSRRATSPAPPQSRETSACASISCLHFSLSYLGLGSPFSGAEFVRPRPERERSCPVKGCPRRETKTSNIFLDKLGADGLAVAAVYKLWP